jgi:FkbM family methyltransferase
MAVLGRKFPDFRKIINLVSKMSYKISDESQMKNCSVNGFKYDLNLKEYIQYQMYFFGLFDKKGVDLIVSICDSIGCRTALDIGANVGNHSVHLSDVCDAVYSFEPNDTPGDVFKKALKTKESSIKLFNFGLSNKDEKLEFYEDERNLGRSSFVKEHIEKKQFNSKKILEVKRGDEVIIDNNIVDIDFIKIDVEGFEIQVLYGLKKTIRENQPIIDFEFNEITRDGFGDLNTLKSTLSGYSFYGTRRCGLGLMKEKLKITEFDFERDYAHVLAIPSRFSYKF